ncbi:MAG: hypothetical protein AAFO07_10175, partial [Bacteroidota bacterium]
MTFEELNNSLQTNWEHSFPVALFPIKMQLRFMRCMHIAKVDDGTILAFPDEVVETELSGNVKSSINDLKDRLSDNKLPFPAAILTPGHTVIATGDEKFPSKGIAPQPDTHELWIRFYPDDIHLTTHEKVLTLDEKESGKDFWREMNNAAQLTDHTERKSYRIGAWRVLTNGYGNARGAWIARMMRPSNYDETIFQDNEALIFPELEGDATTSTWNVAPYTEVLPDHFVVKLYPKVGAMSQNIFVGNTIPEEVQLSVNPNDDTKLFQENETGLDVPKGMKWLIDFDEAVKVGMAIRIPLENADLISNGFDKIVALGVKNELSASDSQSMLETLFDNHHYKPGGMSIVPHGTPSNNTEVANSGQGLEDLDPLESYELELGDKQYMPTDDHVEKSDGQRLAEALGLDDKTIQSIYYNTGKDISNAIKMNQALWHSTLGYSLPQYFFPDMTQVDVDQTCKFMVNYALCRGYLPTLRIDDQPYGILPATIYEDIVFDANDAFESFINQMNDQFLKKLDDIWENLVADVAKISKDTDVSNFTKEFYRVLELHASSVTYDQQLVLGENLVDDLSASGSGDTVLNDAGKKAAISEAVQSGFTYNIANAPLALTYTQGNQLATLNNGFIVDRLPSDETQLIETIEGTEKNYLEWLGDFTTKIDHLVNEDFSNFTDADLSNPPQSFLYNLSRYALFRHYLLVAMKLKYGDSNASLTQAFSVDYEENVFWLETNLSGQIEKVTINPKFEFVLRKLLEKDSSFEEDIDEYIQNAISTEENIPELYSNNKLAVFDAQINRNGEDISIKDYIDNNLELGTDSDLNGLLQHKQFFQALSKVSNAQLKRIFTEHLDACHYRLDAWQSGLANYRLEQMRASNEKGIYLGAYGYLENVIPNIEAPAICIVKDDDPTYIDNGSGAMISPVFAIPSGINEELFFKNNYVYLGNENPFQYIGYDEIAGMLLPLPQDNPNNQGFIPTPSLVHAVTAAVLKNAHTSHKNDRVADAQDTFAINLSSS